MTTVASRRERKKLAVRSQILSTAIELFSSRGLDAVTIVVIHRVPPQHPNLQLPAEWMQVPVADTANNWVEVAKIKDGKSCESLDSM